jgi:aminocarboxymuconate-semialdehyde decarboxylase
MVQAPTLRPRAIDMHCHLLNQAVEGMVADSPQKRREPEAQILAMGEASARHNDELNAGCYRPKLTDLAVRLADMDAMGVDIQVISPAPAQYYYWAGRDQAQAIVTAHNEGIAAAVATHPDRFVGLGSVAMQFPELAAEQADHAVRTLGLRGVEISSLVNGEDLSDRRFDPFWAKMEALGAVVFLHPLGTSLGARLNSHYLANIVGQPAETAVSLSKLIFTGMLDRHPAIKLVAAHGGGYLPLAIGRSDHGYAARPEAKGCAHHPSHYLRRLWFDTVVHDSAQLRRLIDTVGASQVVLGTDYPYDMGHYDPHGLIAAVPDLTEAEAAAILGENAAALLGLDPLRSGSCVCAVDS